MEGTRGRSAGEWGDLRGLSADSDMTSGTWRQPRAVSVRTAETCAGQVLRPPAEIQARMERGQSARGRDDVSRETFLHSGRLTPAFRFALSF